MYQYAFFLGTVVACVVFWSVPGTNGIAIRPFKHTASNASGCSTETALSGPNCPCNLNGQRCNGAGLFCIKNVCKCGTNFLNITTNGNQLCYEKFFVIVPSSVTNSPTGVTVPCALASGQNIPGLKLQFVGAVAPVACNPSTLYITNESGAAGDLQQDEIPSTNAVDVIPPGSPGVSYVGVDINTGDVYLNPLNVNGLGLVINQPTTASLTETYSGYCIDARGITSNTFSFMVTFPLCP